MIELVRRGESERRSFYEGLKHGVTLFAWWKDGVQYVGTAGLTLAEGLKLIESMEEIEKDLQPEIPKRRVAEDIPWL